MKNVSKNRFLREAPKSRVPPGGVVKITVWGCWGEEGRGETDCRLNCRIEDTATTKRIQGYKIQDTRIQGYKDTGYKDTRIQGYKIQGYKDTRYRMQNSLHSLVAPKGAGGFFN